VRTRRDDSLLATVGARVRSTREALGLSRRELSGRCGVSERFLAQLEGGEGNISLARFAEVAAALETTPAELLAGAGLAGGRDVPVALLGVRGAGKSTIGARLARRLGARFVEVDQRIEQAAGLRLGEIFEMHGEAYYRRLEREVLARLLAEPRPLVLAAGGSIVNDPATYGMLRERAQTVWLRARAEDHWNRVVQQGDPRPMAENPHAFAELRALLAAREAQYARAGHVVDTSGRSILDVVEAVAVAVGATAPRRDQRPGSSSTGP
jgi:XRE family transcriptional regulator, aerobic/anaerobic benzoate catabolism transcriptional regulator